MGCSCASSALLLDNLTLHTFQVKVTSRITSIKRQLEAHEFALTAKSNSLQRVLVTKAFDSRHVFPSLGPDVLLDDGDFGNNHNSSSNNNNNNNNNNGGGNNNNHNNNDGGRNNEESDDWNLHNLAAFWSYNFASLLRSQLWDGNISVHEGTPSRQFLLYLLPLLGFLGLFHLGYARALEGTGQEEEKKDEEVVWEIKGSKRTKLVPDTSKDEFVVVSSSSLLPRSSSANGNNKLGDVASSAGIHGLWLLCKDVVMRLMLPEGFPDSVTSDYLDYSLWRGVQGIASQISGVLATQSLLYAVGLGKGAIPTAAAINWVLKDGIGYLSKIMLSKYGRHFDVNPKGWRLWADLLENTAIGLEILTPAFPHLFVFIGAAAGAGRSAASLIQAATRSCFYAGFAAKRNFAEVIAKGEAQGMVSKSIGIMLGIALADGVGSSTPLALACFGVVTWIHMLCNLKSYQCIQLRTLNPYRANIRYVNVSGAHPVFLERIFIEEIIGHESFIMLLRTRHVLDILTRYENWEVTSKTRLACWWFLTFGLVFSEYLISGQVPSVKEVNDEEPLFPAIPILNLRTLCEQTSSNLSVEAKNAAAEIVRRLELGSTLSDIVQSREDAVALFDLYRAEGYILAEHKGKFCVILKESALPRDMLRSLYQVNFLYWLETNAGVKSRNASEDCRPGGKLHLSLEYVQREFNHVKNDSELAGWVTDGLIARPLPHRICLETIRAALVT
ncbi:hypothetical protein Cgig2_029783 [Carnegiea gigantea]|uniref:Uncharacterized protein n=1 Tax=Carnegiea gigantea TaxID=171969 RepID=A0A9Q1QJT3_9CARY|nr:hypothetical protein Cgig2_029783 [Carnegiea gigantea]